MQQGLTPCAILKSNEPEAQTQHYWNTLQKKVKYDYSLYSKPLLIPGLAVHSIWRYLPPVGHVLPVLLGISVYLAPLPPLTVIHLRREEFLALQVLEVDYAPLQLLEATLLTVSHAG